MTPDRQAQLLAHWLHQEPGGAVPDELDEDVVEAVYALRPDLAPAPRLTIEQILEEVHEGPLALTGAARPDAARVQALMAWLEAAPGRAPGPEIDPDVVEAVYAMRPDLAPAPTLSLDDILGAVTSGPFAAASTAAAPSPVAPSPAASSPVAPSPVAARPRGAPPGPERRRSTPTRRVPTWLVPSLGAVAVAATALMLVIPASRKAMDAPSPFDAQERAAAAPEAAPAAAPPAAAPLAAEPPDAAQQAKEKRAEDAPAPEEDATDDALAPVGLADLEAKAAPAAEDPADAMSAGETRNRQDAPAPQAGPVPAETITAEPLAAMTEQPIGGLYAGDQDRARDEGGGAMADGREQEATLGREASRRKSAVASPSKKQEASRASEMAAPAADLEMAEEQAPAASRPAAPAATSTAATSTAAPSTAAPPTAGSSAFSSADAGAASGAGLPSPASSAGPAGLSLAQLRAAAWPLGGYPDPTAGRADVAAAHSAAAEADARGDSAGFIAALRPLLAHGTADVALDAGYRIARRQQAQGDLSGALATVAQALARGGSGLQRARLYALQGEVYERRGDPERAATAYRAAIQAR